VKESLDGEFVKRTVPRSTLWEVHTPTGSSYEHSSKGLREGSNRGVGSDR